EKTFSWAFSRIEQVLRRITSASAAFCVISMAWCSPSRSTMRELSYSFIWQPWVSMKSLRVMLRAGAVQKMTGDYRPGAGGRKADKRAGGLESWTKKPAHSLHSNRLGCLSPLSPLGRGLG